MNHTNEVLQAKPWKGDRPPGRILAIRLQAFGDVVITLPWLASLREQFPQAKIDFLVLDKNSELPAYTGIFNSVYRIHGGKAKVQFLYAHLLLPALFLNRYDVVIDLQRNNISRWIRFLLFPKAWSEIERFSRTLAGQKFKTGIEAAGFNGIEIPKTFRIGSAEGKQILMTNGWNATDKLVVLNPAGASASRHWPLQYYIEFAKIFAQQAGPPVMFLFLGVDRILEKTREICSGLEPMKTINLVSRLTPSQSFSVLQHVQIVVSEDSGLMHMAWVQRIPTLALFGSSPSYWSAPMGSWTKCMSSSDLPCGDCCLEVCKYGDVRCLTRVSPEQVLKEVKSLLGSPVE